MKGASRVTRKSVRQPAAQPSWGVTEAVVQTEEGETEL
jgi:hypothetical protein